MRAAPLFAAMANATVPFPVPLAPLVTEIQLALLAAFHPQLLADAVTATDPFAPAALAD